MNEQMNIRPSEFTCSKEEFNEAMRLLVWDCRFRVPENRSIRKIILTTLFLCRKFNVVRRWNNNILSDLKRKMIESDSLDMIAIVDRVSDILNQCVIVNHSDTSPNKDEWNLFSDTWEYKLSHLVHEDEILDSWLSNIEMQRIIPKESIDANQQVDYLPRIIPICVHALQNWYTIEMDRELHSYITNLERDGISMFDIMVTVRTLWDAILIVISRNFNKEANAYENQELIWRTYHRTRRLSDVFIIWILRQKFWGDEKFVSEVMWVFSSNQVYLKGWTSDV